MTRRSAETVPALVLPEVASAGELAVSVRRAFAALRGYLERRPGIVLLGPVTYKAGATVRLATGARSVAGLVVVRCVARGTKAPASYTAPLWRVHESGEIELTGIGGLTAGTEYDVTFVVAEA